MDRLTNEERRRMIEGFLMVAGGIALAMVLFAVMGLLDLMAIILAIVGTVIALIVSPALWFRRQPARVVYGTMVTGLGVITGAVGGKIVIDLVTTAFL